MTNTSRMKAAHKAHKTQEKAARKQAAAAKGFRYRAGYEALLKLKETSPDKYDALPAKIKTSLGYYLREKTAAAAEGIDVTGGPAE